MKESIKSKVDIIFFVIIGLIAVSYLLFFLNIHRFFAADIDLTQCRVEYTGLITMNEDNRLQECDGQKFVPVNYALHKICSNNSEILYTNMRGEFFCGMIRPVQVSLLSKKDRFFVEVDFFNDQPKVLQETCKGRIDECSVQILPQFQDKFADVCFLQGHRVKKRSFRALGTGVVDNRVEINNFSKQGIVRDKSVHSTIRISAKEIILSKKDEYAYLTGIQAECYFGNKI